MQSGISRVLFFVAALRLGSCSGVDNVRLSQEIIPNVEVSWTANLETAVNTTGGGYRVYYGTHPGFSTSSASSVDVPYVSGASTPTSVKLTGLHSGIYYFKVVAYSALNPPGGSTGSTSSPSSEISISLP